MESRGSYFCDDQMMQYKDLQRVVLRIVKERYTAVKTALFFNDLSSQVATKESRGMRPDKSQQHFKELDYQKTWCCSRKCSVWLLQGMFSYVVSCQTKSNFDWELFWHMESDYLSYMSFGHMGEERPESLFFTVDVILH